MNIDDDKTLIQTEEERRELERRLLGEQAEDPTVIDSAEDRED